MPYPRTPQQYPTIFFNIAERLAERPQSTFLQIFRAYPGDKRPFREALRFRETFYAFGRACRTLGRPEGEVLLGYEARVGGLSELDTKHIAQARDNMVRQWGVEALDDHPSQFCFALIQSRDHTALAHGAQLALASMEAFSGGSTPTRAFTPEELIAIEKAKALVRQPSAVPGSGARSAFESIYGPARANNEGENKSENTPPAYPKDPRGADK